MEILRALHWPGLLPAWQDNASRFVDEGRHTNDSYMLVMALAAGVSFAFLQVLLSSAAVRLLNEANGEKCKGDDSNWKLVMETRQLFVYSILMVLGWSLCLYDPSNILSGGGEAHFDKWPTQTNSPAMRTFYLLQLAFNISFCITPALLPKMVKSAPREQGGLDTMVHHLFTIYLVVGSWIYNFVRLGALVFALHDVSSVFLKLGRLGVALEWERLKNISLKLFAITFFMFRIVGIPMLVYPSASFEVKQVQWWMYPVFQVALCGLYVLHVGWFVKIVKIVLRKSRGYNSKEQ